ncbi:hypothetical protein D5086_021734 [Populus alba]|uniref:Uncharacterized protein n=2 Tax=Populus alba TaxID=43335 RepID=A0ACC4BDJ2_POPAL|nr:hypothetical protein D5086_0000222270 [Populus alba]
MISGMTALCLHMFCEFRGEIHVVEDQIGCEVMQVDNMAVKSSAPYMKIFMKFVTFSLKIGAHLATAMGEMMPDLSREGAHLTGSSLLNVAQQEQLLLELWGLQHKAGGTEAGLQKAQET